MLSPARRVGRLEERLSASKAGNCFRVIMGLQGESEEDAERRHLREHPEDDDPSLFFILVLRMEASSEASRSTGDRGMQANARTPPSETAGALQ